MSHLVAGRAQMGTSLAFHLSFAALGVGLPFMMLIAEGLHLHTGDRVWLALARRWSKAFAILFAVGAVSGTIISFELGLLWQYASLGATAWSSDLLAGLTLIALGARARHVGHHHTGRAPRPGRRA